MWDTVRNSLFGLVVVVRIAFDVGQDIGNSFDCGWDRSTMGHLLLFLVYVFSRCYSFASLWLTEFSTLVWKIVSLTPMIHLVYSTTGVTFVIGHPMMCMRVLCFESKGQRSFYRMDQMVLDLGFCEIDELLEAAVPLVRLFQWVNAFVDFWRFLS